MAPEPAFPGRLATANGQQRKWLAVRGGLARREVGRYNGGLV